MLRENDRLSLYLFPLADKCRVNTRERADNRRTRFGDLWEFLRTSVDALGAVSPISPARTRSRERGQARLVEASLVR